MSQPEVYQEIKGYLGRYLQPGISQWTLDRVTLLASGIVKAQHAAPAKIAEAGKGFSERGVQADSVERRIRRIENDPHIQVATCFQPLIKQLLANSRISELWLIVDPTFQEDRVVLVSVNVWYRGRSLPVVWATWPANQPLAGDGFWQRVGDLLATAKRLLPAGIPVTVLADRAFGTPAFTDRVEQQGWHWIVRVQGQTKCRDWGGRERAIAQLVHQPGDRRKLRGQVFKKAGWRAASVVVYWGKRFRSPLCLVSDLAADWSRMAEYRRRFPIEPTFRDWKAYGWRWEQGQVSNLDHLNRLILGMALANWLVILVGALQAQIILAQPASGNRRTRPWWGKKSLFRLGLDVWQECFAEGFPPWLRSALPDWAAPNWIVQITAHQAFAFVFA